MEIKSGNCVKKNDVRDEGGSRKTEPLDNRMRISTITALARAIHEQSLGHRTFNFGGSWLSIYLQSSLTPRDTFLLLNLFVHRYFCDSQPWSKFCFINFDLTLGDLGLGTVSVFLYWDWDYEVGLSWDNSFTSHSCPYQSQNFLRLILTNLRLLYTKTYFVAKFNDFSIGSVAVKKYHPKRKKNSAYFMAF